MAPRTVTRFIAGVLAAQAVGAAVDCSGEAEWDVQFIPESYIYDPATVTTKMCYSVAYKQPYPSGECAPAGGQAQAMTKFGARFLSCFTNENGGLRAEEGTWDPAPTEEGYAEETMEGEVQFNGNLWTGSVPATGSSGQLLYCVTMKRKLNLAQTPNTEFFATDGSRFSITSLVGPECYLEPTTTVPPPPPTTTVPPTTTTVPPTTTTVPPTTTSVPPTTTTVPPTTTTVPPTTTPPPTTIPPTTTTIEPSAHYAAKPEEVEVVVAPSAGTAAPSAATEGTTTASPTGVYVGAAVGASLGAGLLAAAAAAFVYKRRSATELPSLSQEVLA